MCASQISQGQLAASVHVSEDYLAHIFLRELGLSPWEYINHLCVSITVEMLLHTGKPIYSLALESGKNTPTLTVYSRKFTASRRTN
jgi:AraC-like DNA-binding protein